MAKRLFRVKHSRLAHYRERRPNCSVCNSFDNIHFFEVSYIGITSSRNYIMFAWQTTKLSQCLASSAGICSCHFRSYTISSSSNTSGRRPRASAEQSEARDGAWGEKKKRLPFSRYWIICSSGPIPHSYQLLSITMIWPTSSVTHSWSIKFPAVFVKNKHKRRLRRRLHNAPKHASWIGHDRTCAFFLPVMWGVLLKHPGTGNKQSQ